MNDIQAPVSSELDAVFAELQRIVVADFSLINEVNECLVQVRGKMFRPTLLLLSARAVGIARPVEVTLGAVVELIHLATLIHDDSVDHSVLRRGQPTVNARFSHEVAVIMGDYLYSRAIQELVAVESPEPLRIMSRVTNELTVGEMREVVAYDALDFTLNDYEALIRAKTASLMAGACEVGALVGGDAFRAPLREFGTHLGMAFQIADDVLDYTESQAVTGKPAGQDLREHKITLPLIAALPRMSPSETEQVHVLMADPAPPDDMIASVIRIVQTCGGIEAARQRAHHVAARAEGTLEGIPSGPARDALRDCLAYAVDRRS